MKFRNVITAAAIAALSVAAHAATFVVPAAGTGPGANGSQWQSELTIHTAAPRPVTLRLSFHRGTDVAGPVEVTLQPRETVSFADVVRTKFGIENATGALVIEASDRDAKTLAITSRTFNVSAEGEFGQDIPSVDTSAAARAGDVAAINGPSSNDGTRFNFGVYAIEATTVQWQVIRRDGTVGTQVEVHYAAGQHVQYNGGIQSLLGTTPAENDTVHARLTDGKAIFYGSVINRTGDPTFVPALRTRDDIAINFAGLDLDENGTVDIADADGDGVLDAAITVYASMFPNYFRIVAGGEFGESVTFEVVSTPAPAVLLDASGTMRVTALGDVKGKSGEIRVKATSGTSSSILTIPVMFK